MTGNASADIVFVLDASGSMTSCINAVKKHIHDFVEVFKQDANQSWDLRLEFVAHTTYGSFEARSVHHDEILPALYEADTSSFFTDSVEAFQSALAKVSTGADECPLLALDCALDLPWRSRGDCRRAVILLTDEPVDGGSKVTESIRLLPELISKIHSLGVILFLVTPECENFEDLSAADKCQWEVVPEDSGLSSTDFSKLLPDLAKTITLSQTPLGGEVTVKRALFGQDGW